MPRNLVATGVVVKAEVCSGTSVDGDELADFGALDGLLDVMPTLPAPPPSWRGRMADRIEQAAGWMMAKAWDLAASVRGS
jgi:hypothetical protein